jgi:dTDP-4-dehydrorhamnose 3,5-epimerase
MRLLKLKRVADDRGWFAETFSEDRYRALGVDCRFCQDNFVFSASAGVLRGLHFQRPPFAQAKLVSCVRGRIWDVAVDVRQNSPTYGRWQGVELCPENGLQVFVPTGYAHGYVTLEPNTEVCYKVDSGYAPQSEGGLIWNDPSLAIEWPLQGVAPLVSRKDELLPGLQDLDSPFEYEGDPLLPLEVI